jgi:DNA repair photolyase
VDLKPPPALGASGTNAQAIWPLSICVLYACSVRPLAVWNPPNPWSKAEVEWLEPPPEAPLQTFEEDARSILSRNESPDVPMKWSLNPYRGCVHGCAYCYARPTHQYLGFGAGSDFDRKIVVKRNAVELLRATFDKRGWEGESITFSGNTDCYQPLEASYRLTRRCLELCLEYRNPASVITKSALVRRDVELLAALARAARASVTISIPFADDAMARAIEPYASAPSARFETIRLLTDAGIPTSVNVAPVIPGLNDPQIGEILERAAAAGATGAGLQPVRLAAEVLPVFFERLQQAYPQRAAKIESAIRQVRGGKLNLSEFGKRMSGEGPRWRAVEGFFRVQAARLGLDRFDPERQASACEVETKTFRRPNAQGELFG